jgi:hypothetical protein
LEATLRNREERSFLRLKASSPSSACWFSTYADELSYVSASKVGSELLSTA